MGKEAGVAMKTKAILYLGWGIPALFWLTTAACAALLGGYRHLERQVSELGALGTPTSHAFTAGMLLCAVLSVPFLLGLLRRCREAGLNPWPVYLLFCFPLSLGGAAIFPMPLELHGLAGELSLPVPLSPLLALCLWRRPGRPSGAAGVAVPAALLMLLGFLVFLPGWWPAAVGLKQRFFHLGWTLWFAGLGTVFARPAGAPGARRARA